MNSESNNMPMSTVLMISAAFGVVFLFLFMLVGGFGFWGALLWGLLIAIAVFVILLMMFAGNGDHASAGPASGSSGASSGSAIAKDVKATDASTGAAATGASVAATAGGADSAADGAKPGSSSAAGADPAQPKPGAKGVSAASAQPGASVKASTSLPGQNDLSSRKGSYKYESGAGADAKPAKPAKAAKAKPAKPAPKAAKPAAGAADVGSQPAALSGPRDTGADDLRKIKGVGPKLQAMLNGMGIYHFDQVATWGDAEIAWADQNLKGFKGRVSRDDWVAQAKILAAGGETEFSRKSGA